MIVLKVYLLDEIDETLQQSYLLLQMVKSINFSKRWLKQEVIFLCGNIIKTIISLNGNWQENIKKKGWTFTIWTDQCRHSCNLVLHRIDENTNQHDLNPYIGQMSSCQRKQSCKTWWWAGVQTELPHHTVACIFEQPLESANKCTIWSETLGTQLSLKNFGGWLFNR